MAGTTPIKPVDVQLSDEQKRVLIEAAKAATSRAYAPYSNFKVGAALFSLAGNIYTGCNVENSSYGLTNCAERTAAFAAIASEGPSMRIRALAVWTDPEGACSPCGACRQVLFELGPDAVVLFQGEAGVQEARCRELLPAGFML